MEPRILVTLRLILILFIVSFLGLPPVFAESPSTVSPSPAPKAADFNPSNGAPKAEAAPPEVTDEASREAEAIQPPPAPSLPLKRSARVPHFQDVKPQWGLQLNFSPRALGGVGLTPEQGTLPAFAFSVSPEFQPRFLQFFGVIGIGPSVSIYPILGGNNLTPRWSAIWSVGGQIRYQAKYFRQQILVPNIAYAFEYLGYAYSAGQSGNLQAQGPVYGLWLLLNKLDPSAAADFYIDAGVARSYLIFEARNVLGRDANISINGFSYYVGLRVEM